MTDSLRGATIAFYSDSAVFGGHEAMTLRMANELREQTEADLHLFHHHPRFAKAAPGIHRHRLPFRSRRPLPFLRNLNPAHVLAARNLLREVDPDLVLVSQGNVELGLKGVLAGLTLRAKTASYIPLAFTFAESGSHVARLRDAVDRIYYRLPDAYLIVADYQARLLARFVDRPIHVVPSPLDDARPEPRVRLPLPSEAADPVQLALIGRVYFRHKNHDGLLEAARLLRAEGWTRFHVHVAGDGPDLPLLRRMVRNHGLEKHFTLHGWLEEPAVSDLLDRTDLVVIPSHFEGLPLVMLEAAAAGVPFLISRLPFVGDYVVPENHLLTADDPADIARKIVEATGDFDPAAFAALRRRILNKHSPEAFREGLLRAVAELVRER